VKTHITMLVVEDDFLIRLGAADMVRELGFDAVEAVSADEAVGLLEQRNDIDIVFTDIQMPGSMDGLGLVAVVKDRWPPIALLVTSGQVRPSAMQLPSGAVFLSKPYVRAELRAQLDTLLR
jgi:two-component system, response regulator PdtaR